MLGWMMGWVWWFTWRLAVSAACLFTIQNVIHQEGYYIENRVLLVAGICVVVGVRIWMPFKQGKDNDTR